MRALAAAGLCILVVGCGPAPDGSPRVSDGTMRGFVRELAEPGSLHKTQMAEDDAKCRRYGFTPGTAEYANCRMQVDQTRALAKASRDAGILSRN